MAATEDKASGLFAEEDEQREAERIREREQKDFENALASVMATTYGRKVIFRILALTGVNGSVTSTDPMAMMARSARRDVGLELLDQLKRARLDEALLRMEKENK